MAFMRCLNGQGGGGGGYSFIDDYTQVECVAAKNPSGTSMNLSIPDIPKTSNVIYALATQGYATRFNIGQKYNLESLHFSMILLGESGVDIDSSSYGYTLSGTTLSTSDSGGYTNIGLFIIGEK